MELLMYYQKRSNRVKERNGKTKKNLGGIKEMEELPGVLLVVDPKKERTAILEARILEYSNIR